MCVAQSLFGNFSAEIFQVILFKNFDITEAARKYWAFKWLPSPSILCRRAAPPSRRGGAGRTWP
jgi:hypothetical protein